MTPDVVPIILPLVWGAILALAVFLYVLLGGYDLGLGVLFPLAPTHQDRDAMMGSVAPFWDGNETWLVLGGGGLLAAFPLAYAVMLPALYIPIILMLIGLILRGVAFEFRFKSSTYRWAWDLAFAGGSIVACRSALIGTVTRASSASAPVDPTQAAAQNRAPNIPPRDAGTARTRGGVIAAELVDAGLSIMVIRLAGWIGLDARHDAP